MNDNSRLSNRLGWILAGACVLLILVGFVLRRWSAPSAELSHASQPAATNWPGATRMNGDVPVGYAHTSAGAIAAATNYGQAAEPFLLQPARYRTALAVIAVPSDKEQMLAQADLDITNLESYTGALTNASRGVREVIRTIPVTYQVQAYTPSRAVVEIWEVLVMAEDKVLGPTQTWALATVVLEWVAGDWHESTATTVRAGAIPHLGQSTTLDTSLPP